MGFILFWIYRLFISPMLLLATLTFAWIFSKKIKVGLKMRLNNPWNKLEKNTQPIWIHCSSGEFEYAKAVIREIKLSHPNEKILVTYFSPSYKKSIENFPGVDLSTPLPWDLPGPMRSFIEYHSPKLLLIARTDLWPEMIYQVKLKKIPSIIFSVTKNSAPNPLHLYLMEMLNEVHCVSPEDKININLKDVVVKVCGDTRFDQALFRMENPKPITCTKGGPTTPVLVAGSTWPEDENVILPSITKLLKDKQLRLVIAPHEPTEKHMQSLFNWADSAEIEYQKYTETTDWTSTVLFVDTVGVLAELYLFGDLAFVGGSFKASVHSVMEPLAANLPVLLGPYYDNNREALEFVNTPITPKSKFTVVQFSRSKEEFEEKIKAILKDGLRAPIREKIIAKAGGSKQLAKLVNKFFE